MKWNFIPTSEGILLVAEPEGHIRGATEIEKAYYAMLFEKADDPPLRRMERLLVRALRDGDFGQPSQVTHGDRFEMATDDLIIRVSTNDGS